MEIISREQFQQRLQNKWQALPARFQQLSAADQAAYLQKQGYATLGGLLSHVLAWWQDGAQNIARLRADPALPPADYDVDAFNAQAVARFAPLGEAGILQQYQAQCQTMLNLVSDLSEAELLNERINRRLYYEIVGHWDEHELE